MAAVAKTGGFSIRISAVDETSKTLTNINKRLAAMQAPLVKMHQQVQKFAKLSGLSAVANGFKQIGSMAMGAARAIASVIPGLGAITGAATIAGMFALVNSWQALGTKLLHASQLLGVSVPRMQAMSGAARLMGGDAEAMGEALNTLGSNVQDAIAGRAPEFLQRMAQMGIALTDSNGKARNTADIFDDIQSVLSRYSNAQVRARTATELMGGAGTRLLPILGASSEAWKKAQEEAKRYGVTTDGAARQADLVRRSQTAVTLALEGMGQAIATQVGPKLEALFVKFAEWLVKITPQVVALVERFATWLDGDWTPFLTGVDKAWEALKSLNLTVEKIVTGMEVLFGLWAVSKISGMLTGVARLGMALTSAFAPLASLLLRLAPWATFLYGMRPATTNGGRSEEDPSESNETAELRRRGLSIPAGAAPTGDRAAMERSIYDGLRARGLSHEDASGATANAMLESAGVLTATNMAGGGIGAHGLFQQRGDRARMADGRLSSEGTLDQQLDHFIRDRDNQRSAMANSRVEMGLNGNVPFEPGTAGYSGYLYGHGFERHGTGPGGSPAARHAENLRRAAEAEAISQRARARGQTPAAAAPARGVDAVTSPVGPQSSLTGSATLQVAFANAPAGMQVNARTSGDLFGAPPTISMGMPTYASA